MKTALILASVATSASAFVPSKKASSVSSAAASKADLEVIAEKANPVVKFYDPVSLVRACMFVLLPCAWSSNLAP